MACDMPRDAGPRFLFFLAVCPSNPCVLSGQPWAKPQRQICFTTPFCRHCLYRRLAALSPWQWISSFSHDPLSPFVRPRSVCHPSTHAKEPDLGPALGTAVQFPPPSLRGLPTLDFVRLRVPRAIPRPNHLTSATCAASLVSSSPTR